MALISCNHTTLVYSCLYWEIPVGFGDWDCFAIVGCWFNSQICTILY